MFWSKTKYSSKPNFAPISNRIKINNPNNNLRYFQKMSRFDSLFSKKLEDNGQDPRKFYSDSRGKNRHISKNASERDKLFVQKLEAQKNKHKLGEQFASMFKSVANKFESEQDTIGVDLTNLSDDDDGVSFFTKRPDYTQKGKCTCGTFGDNSRSTKMMNVPGIVKSRNRRSDTDPIAMSFKDRINMKKSQDQILRDK